MLTSGDVVDLDLGVPSGRESGFLHPVVVVTAQEVLDESASVIHVVPMTSKLREFGSEIEVIPDERNGLDEPSSAQCQHIRSVSVNRVETVRGNVGSVTLSQIRESLSLILDLT